MAFSIPMASYRSARGANPIQLLLSLVDQANGGFDEARQANESRYLDILELFGDNRQRALADLKGFGDQLVADTTRDYDNKRDDLITDLANRGLAGSTARIPVEMKAKREKDAALNRIKDMLTENRLATDERFTDKAAGVMERRDDPYPENRQASLAAILSQLGPLLGGNGGGLGNLLGGGRGRQPRYNAPNPFYNAPGAAQANTLDAQRAQEAYLASVRGRNAALANLHNAVGKGGIEGEDQVRQLMDYMQRQGYAQYNPTQGVPAVEPPRAFPILPSGGSYGVGGRGYGGGPVYGPAWYHRRQDEYRKRGPALARNALHNAGQALFANSLPALGGTIVSQTPAPVQQDDPYAGVYGWINPAISAILNYVGR